MRSGSKAGHEPTDLATAEGNPHDRTDVDVLALADRIGKPVIDSERWHIGNDPGNEREVQKLSAAAARVAAMSSASHENCERPK